MWLLSLALKSAKEREGEGGGRGWAERHLSPIRNRCGAVAKEAEHAGSEQHWFCSLDINLECGDGETA